MKFSLILKVIQELNNRLPHQCHSLDRVITNSHPCYKL